MSDKEHSDWWEQFRWGDIPDCKKYKNLLESPDKDTVKMAIELLKIDGVDEYQIRRCNERFLHIIYWDIPDWDLII